MISSRITSRPASRPTGAEIFAQTSLKSTATTRTVHRELFAFSARDILAPLAPYSHVAHFACFVHFVKIAALTAAFMASGYVVLWKPVLERWIF